MNENVFLFHNFASHFCFTIFVFACCHIMTNSKNEKHTYAQKNLKMQTKGACITLLMFDNAIFGKKDVALRSDYAILGS
jgi:hypothetical protein